MVDETAKKKKKKRGPRRFNGTGSVYKLKGRRRRPWVATISPENDENGKPIPLYSYHETAFDANNAIPVMEAEYWEKKGRSPYADDTVEMVWERVKTVRFPKLDEDTVKGYLYTYAHWSDIYDRRIADLVTSDLEKIILDREHMSFSHLSKMRSLAVMIWNRALKDEIVKKNYASGIELPKAEPETSRRSYTDEELLKINQAAFGKLGVEVPYADVELVMCYMGWRPTEMCRLEPKDVDTEKWFIRGGIKTEAGENRIIPVHSLIQPIIQNWLGKGHDRLFTNEEGKPLNKDTWANRHNKAMMLIFGDRIAVPYTTRHTCASILHAAGADHLSIAKIMGHKDYKITARTYTHVQLRELKTAIDTLDSVLAVH